MSRSNGRSRGGTKFRGNHTNDSRITREIRADHTTDTTYTYDLAGRLKTVTDPKDQVRTYTYNVDDTTDVINENAGEGTDAVVQTSEALDQLPAGSALRERALFLHGRALEATGDYIVDEKHKTVTLTESGMAKAGKCTVPSLSIAARALWMVAGAFGSQPWPSWRSLMAVR